MGSMSRTSKAAGDRYGPSRYARCFVCGDPVTLRLSHDEGVTFYCKTEQIFLADSGAFLLRGDRPPRCRTWIEKMIPAEPEVVEMVTITNDTPAEEVKQMFEQMYHQARIRIYCERFDGHTSSHKFQFGHSDYLGKKKK